MTNKLSLALAAALFALPTFAFAQDTAASAAEETMAAEEAPVEEKAAEESKSNLSFNAAVVSDYVFRGVTQTDFDPAFQAGVDYSFGDSGFYVGGWGSNVNFGSELGHDFEVDLYAGYNVDVSDDWNLDLNVTRYNYLGGNDGFDINYSEFIGAVTYSEMLTFTLGYANDYANGDEDQLYLAIGGSWELGSGLNLTAGVGRSSFDDTEDYTDWTLGLNRDFGPINVGLNYYDTNKDDKASDQIVLGFSVGG